MRKLRMLLIVFGLLFVGAGLYALAVGRLKWNPEKTLEGTQARLAGLGALAVGAGLALCGLLVPSPVWEEF